MVSRGHRVSLTDRGYVRSATLPMRESSVSMLLPRFFGRHSMMDWRDQRNSGRLCGLGTCSQDRTMCDSQESDSCRPRTCPVSSRGSVFSALYGSIIGPVEREGTCGPRSGSLAQLLEGKLSQPHLLIRLARACKGLDRPFLQIATFWDRQFGFPWA